MHGNLRVVRSDPPLVYRLTITLSDVEPAVWRRVETLRDATLYRVHEIIQAAMGWEDRHLHAFTVGGKTYGTPDTDIPDDERPVRLDSLISAPGQRLRYVYDFGDTWRHDVLVEAIAIPDEKASYPRFIDGKNACRPEDVGGPPGYEAFLEAIRDPRHEQHQELSEWIGGSFDASRLDRRRITAAFRGLRPA